MPEPIAERPYFDLVGIVYKMRHGPPVWVLRPKIVLAWTEFPKTMTRFRW